MPKPILLAIDDDTSVLEAVVQACAGTTVRITALSVPHPVRPRWTSAASSMSAKTPSLSFSPTSACPE